MDSKTGTAHPEYYKDIDSVQIVNSHTLRIKLKNVSSMFLFNLARPDSVIVNKLAIDKLKTAPVGTVRLGLSSGFGRQCCSGQIR